jgi:hypothetical protein
MFANVSLRLSRSLSEFTGTFHWELAIVGIAYLRVRHYLNILEFLLTRNSDLSSHWRILSWN